MAEEATQTAVETNNGGEQTQNQQTQAVEGQNVQQSQQTVENKPAETQEPALTIESYGNLGLTENEDVKLDAGLLDGFKKLALENNIKPEVANKIAKLQFDHEQKEANNFKELQKKWDEENAATYGDNLKNVQTNVGRVLAEFDKSGKFKELLTLAGAVNAPATLAFLKAIGEKTLEKPSVNPNTNTVPSQPKDLEDFYNN